MIKSLRPLAVLFFCLPLTLRGANSRCGSEGPQPLFDVTGKIKSQSRVVETKGSVQDFIFLPRRRGILYRNDSNQLWAKFPYDTIKLSTSSIPLSPVTDPSEVWFTTFDGRWFISAMASHSWIKIQSKAQENMKPLYWVGPDLVSVEERKTPQGVREFGFYLYRAGHFNAREYCRVIAPSDDFHLAEGHVFPQVRFFEAKPEIGGTRLSLFTLNARTCQFESQSTYADRIPGEVLRVVHFPGFGAKAIEVDHPVMSLLWDSPSGCRYHDLEGARAIFPSIEHPMLLTWSQSTGVKVVNLLERQSLEILKPGQAGAFDENQAALDGQRRSLYIAPQLVGSPKDRVILEYSLGNYLP